MSKISSRRFLLFIIILLANITARSIRAYSRSIRAYSRSIIRATAIMTEIHTINASARGAAAGRVERKIWHSEIPCCI